MFEYVGGMLGVLNTVRILSQLQGTSIPMGDFYT